MTTLGTDGGCAGPEGVSVEGSVVLSPVGCSSTVSSVFSSDVLLVAASTGT